MTLIQPDETVITGTWVDQDGRLVPDDECRRIERIITTHEITEVARSDDGWSVMYRAKDGRFWVLTYPHSELPGGGPPLLINVAPEDARARFGISE